MKNGAVVLLSGGLDSTVNFYAALKEANAYESLAQKTNNPKYWDLYDKKIQEAEKLESESYERRKELAKIKTVDIPDELNFHVVDAKGKTPQELSKDGDIDSWLQKQLDDAKKAKKAGVKPEGKPEGKSEAKTVS